MSRTVKSTSELQAGMRVVNPILGKKGNIKVNKGEILSQAHVMKLNKWKGLEAANPRGFEVENAVLHTGSDVPDVVDHPERSPIIENGAKQKLQSSMRVPAIHDENGNIINPSPLEKELAQREEPNIVKRGRGRPKKARA